MKRTNKLLTEREFNKIYWLIKANFTPREINLITKRSRRTINRIKKSKADNLNDYRKFVSIEQEKYKNSNTEKSTDRTIDILEVIEALIKADVREVTIGKYKLCLHEVDINTEG